MAGLGTQQPQQGGMQQQAQPAQAPMEQEPMDEAGGAGEASEQEQAAYQKFADALGDIIYPRDTPGEAFPQIVANLKGEFDPQTLSLFEGVDPPLTDSPQDAVAATAVLIILVVDKQMGLLEQSLSEQQADDFSPEEVLREGGKLAVELLIEVSEANNLHDFQEQDVEGVFYRALDLFRVAQEKVNPRVVEALKRGFEEIRAANEQGNLGKVLPGLPGGAPMQQQEA